MKFTCFQAVDGRLLERVQAERVLLGRRKLALRWRLKGSFFLHNAWPSHLMLATSAIDLDELRASGHSPASFAVLGNFSDLTGRLQAVDIFLESSLHHAE